MELSNVWPSSPGAFFKHAHHDRESWECSNQHAASPGEHCDTEGWVRTMHSDFVQPGGRPWRTTDVSNNVADHKVALKTVVPDTFLFTHPVSDKITGSRDRLPPSPGEVVVNKVNVPYKGSLEQETRLTIRDVNKERSNKSQFPNKITSKTTYGAYPNYKTTRDRTYLRCSSPDKEYDLLGLKSTGKITSSP